MTLDELTQRLPIITAGLFALGFILLLLSLVLFRRSRGASYWLHRRSAGRRGLRALLLAMLFLSLSAGFCITTVLFSFIEEEEPADPAPGLTAMADFSSIVSPEGTVATLTLTPTTDDTSDATPTTTPDATESNDIIAEPGTLVAAENSATTSPTPTVTGTASISPTATLTTTATNTATATETQTATASATSTDAPGITPTETTTRTPQPTPTASHTATTMPSQTPSLTATVTLTATNTPSRTPSATPTSTLTATATTTPTLTLTPSQTPTPSITPLPTISINNLNVTPLAEAPTTARLSVYAVDDALNDALGPVDAATTFSNDIARLYFFLEFEDMRSGMLWRWELLRDGEPIAARQRLWGVTGSGRTFFFLRPAEGYLSGEYELRLFVGEDEDATSSTIFTVTP
jgi:hypothetical protein